MSAVGSEDARMETSQPDRTMFDAVAQRDYDGMVKMYAQHAQNAVVSYLAMRTRWASSASLSEQETKSGELYISHILEIT